MHEAEGGQFIQPLGERGAGILAVLQLELCGEARDQLVEIGRSFGERLDDLRHRRGDQMRRARAAMIEDIDRAEIFAKDLIRRFGAIKSARSHTHPVTPGSTRGPAAFEANCGKEKRDPGSSPGGGLI